MRHQILVVDNEASNLEMFKLNLERRCGQSVIPCVKAVAYDAIKRRSDIEIVVAGQGTGVDEMSGLNVLAYAKAHLQDVSTFLFVVEKTDQVLADAAGNKIDGVYTYQEIDKMLRDAELLPKMPVSRRRPEQTIIKGD